MCQIQMALFITLWIRQHTDSAVGWTTVVRFLAGADIFLVVQNFLLYTI